jgi:hypothetical protein
MARHDYQSLRKAPREEDWSNGRGRWNRLIRLARSHGHCIKLIGSNSATADIVERVRRAPGVLFRMHASYVRAEDASARKSPIFRVGVGYRLSIRQFQPYVDASDACACRAIIAPRGDVPYVSLSGFFSEQEQ